MFVDSLIECIDSSQVGFAAHKQICKYCHPNLLSIYSECQVLTQSVWYTLHPNIRLFSELLSWMIGTWMKNHFISEFFFNIVKSIEPDFVLRGRMKEC